MVLTSAVRLGWVLQKKIFCNSIKQVSLVSSADVNTIIFWPFWSSCMHKCILLLEFTTISMVSKVICIIVTPQTLKVIKLFILRPQHISRNVCPWRVANFDIEFFVFRHHLNITRLKFLKFERVQNSAVKFWTVHKRKREIMKLNKMGWLWPL